MQADSIYIVQSQIIGLEKLPFGISKRSVREPFQPIFVSQDCFRDMRTSILDVWRPTPLPSEPFIRGLGQICFNTRSARLSSSSERSYYLPKYLSDRSDYWDPRAKPDKLDMDEQEDMTFWGYKKSLKDQRMNQLYFELRRPLFLKAIYEQQVQADGRLFLHIYPAGYLVINLAIALKHPFTLDKLYIRNALTETRPDATTPKWIWHTRLSTGSLSEILEIVQTNVLKSMFSNCPVVKPSRWQSAIKIISTSEVESLARLLLKGDYEVFEITDDDYIASYSQGIICNFHPARKRKSSLRLFWKIFTLHEFVIFKNHVYDAYADFLRAEILQLRKYRLSYLHKIRENILQFSVFDPLIPEYLYVLDEHIRSANPFYRRVYTSISSGRAFDQRRDRVKNLVAEWESEVAQWDHNLVAIWKKVASPLLSLLGLT